MGKNTFIKGLSAGIVGAAATFLLLMFVFAIVKMFYLIAERDLILSPFVVIFLILAVLAGGFIYGINSYIKKNHNYHLYRPTLANILIAFVLGAGAAFFIYAFVKYNMGLQVNFLVFLGLCIILFLTFYPFSTTFMNIYETLHIKKNKHIKKTSLFTLIIFNPFLVLVYVGLFGMVAYQAIYIPCGVTIAGVDNNQFTANTVSLNIKAGEKIVALDGKTVTSLQDVKDHIASLQSTGKIQVETEKNLYDVQTYEFNGKRQLGLVLKQELCRR